MSIHDQAVFIAGLLIGAGCVVLSIVGASLGRAVAARIAWKDALTQKDRP